MLIKRIASENQMLRRVILVSLLFLAVSIGSCSPGERLTEVRGKVYVGDQSETKGTGFVTFHPDDAKGNKSLEEAVGPIQPDGSYVLETRGKPGAAKGWYKVGVSLAEVMNPNNPYVTNWLMPNPDKYQNWSKSGISIEVVDNPQPGQYDIKLPPLTGAAK
jgi:hypothetical protein